MFAFRSDSSDDVESSSTDNIPESSTDPGSINSNVTPMPTEAQLDTLKTIPGPPRGMSLEGGDDGVMEETDFSCSCKCWGLMLKAYCAPCYSWCKATYHVARSIPVNSMASFVMVAIGWATVRSNAGLVSKRIDGTGLSIYSFVLELDGFGVCLFAVDLVFLFASGLMTGWTREALCGAMTSGVFSYPYGGDVDCRFCCQCCCGTGWFVLTLLVIGSYGAWMAAGFATMMGFCAWFISIMMISACKLSEDDATNLIEILRKRMPDANIGSLDAVKYCSGSLKREIVQGMLFGLVGLVIICAAQVNFAMIMVDSHRVARDERKRVRESVSVSSPRERPVSSPSASL